MFNLHFGPLHAIHPSGTNEDPDSKVHGANMGPTWVLSAPDGPHVGPKNLAIRRPSRLPRWKSWWPMCIMNSRASLLSCAFGKNVLNFCWLPGERAGMAKIKPGQTWQVAFKFKFNTSLLLYFTNIHTCIHKPISIIALNNAIRSAYINKCKAHHQNAQHFSLELNAT